jgi:hypothetical protein
MDPKKPAVETPVPRTREEFEKALAERKATASMLVPGTEPAGQVPASVAASDRAAARYVEHRPAAPPAPVVDVRPAEQAKKEKLDLIAAKVIEIRKAEVELEQQKKNAADLIEQMRLERMALANQKEALEREVGEIQREVAAAEAQHLAAQAGRDQAARGQIAQLPLEQWRAKFREELLPIVTRIVSGLVKLRKLRDDKAATLEKIAALRSPPGIDDGTRSEFIAISTEAGKVLTELHDSIVHHERVLAEAESFVPDPRTSDGKTAINGLRYDLELVSGIVTHRLVDIPQPRIVNPSNGVEGQTNASIHFAERIGSLLEGYAAIQKCINKVARPEVVVTLLPKGEKPRHEQIAALRGPSKDAFDPNQTRAEGVKE